MQKFLRIATGNGLQGSAGHFRASEGLKIVGNLDGKVAIVTGSAKGIGKAAVTLFAERGAAVVVADIDVEGATAAAQELKERGLTALAVGVDVGDEAQVRDMVDSAINAFGGLDILYNNAALVSRDVLRRDLGLIDMDADLFERILRVNTIGPALGAKYAIPAMISRGGGVVLNTLSVTADHAELVRPMYATSKAALGGLTRAIATQYGRSGIRCVGISPGHIVTETSQTAGGGASRTQRHLLLNNHGEPDDIATMAAFLVSDEAKYVTGIVINVDGGFTAHLGTYIDDLEQDVLSVT